MLFEDKFEKIRSKLRTEFDALLAEVFIKQSHPGDLLLICLNGSYEPSVLELRPEFSKPSPFIIGSWNIGLSAETHSHFINRYRKSNTLKDDFSEFLEKLENERADKIEELINIESLSIQMEMMIYLKIWESDFFIKQYYQIVRLLKGEHYDWHFKIKGTSQDTSQGKDPVKERHKVLRLEIRNRLKGDFPNIHNAFNTAFNTQIRNSIAHSAYYILGRNIRLNNFEKESKHSKLEYLSFNDWIEMIHYTMILYDELTGFIRKAKNKYEEDYSGPVSIDIISNKPRKPEYQKLVFTRVNEKSAKWRYSSKEI